MGIPIHFRRTVGPHYVASLILGGIGAYMWRSTTNGWKAHTDDYYKQLYKAYPELLEPVRYPEGNVAAFITGESLEEFVESRQERTELIRERYNELLAAKNNSSDEN
eukprot:TRINITY_DN7548_c0_g1_i1.p1 TRINITY_DN7548_c0_g1~~TRINITY_DN7548_c0_g1_i1.p1  ORF type:complete len:123 (+),score=28.42 TRINITY_DN7548_c0_g1_i1:50-370(+)